MQLYKRILAFENDQVLLVDIQQKFKSTLKSQILDLVKVDSTLVFGTVNC